MTEIIKNNDIVKVSESGKIGIVSQIQYVHDRYLLKHVSGWQYGISGISKVSVDSLIATIESQKEEIKRLLALIAEKEDKSADYFDQEGEK